MLWGMTRWPRQKTKGEVKCGGEDGGEESGETQGGTEGVEDQYCMSEV